MLTDLATTRLRLAHLLDTAALQPEGMPSSGILLVQRLADPLPRGLAPDAYAVCAAPRWERAISATLGECWRDAARPARGSVSASANAVRFDDAGEMLAALAEALASGSSVEQWWWAALLRARGGATLDALIALLHREARYVPAAVRRLAGSGFLARVLSALSPSHAWSVFGAMAEAFNLSALTAAPSPIARKTTAFPERASFVERCEWPATPLLAAVDDYTEPPWAHVVASAVLPETLGEHRLMLGGVALAIHHAPLLVRTRAFQRALLEWRTAFRAREQSAAPDPALAVRPSARAAEPRLSSDAAQEVPSPDLAVPRPLLASTPEATARDYVAVEEHPGTELPMVGQPRALSPTPVERPSTKLDAATESSDASTLHATPGVARASPEAPDDDVDRDEPRTSATAPFPAVATTAAPIVTEAAPQRTTTTVSGPALDLAIGSVEGTTTALGGVLYLVNALDAMRFFDILEEHYGIADALGSWAWLELVARSLIGDRRPELAADPVWAVLAALDGRDSTAPLVGAFRAPLTLALPPQWATPDATRPERGVCARVLRSCRPLGLPPPKDLRRWLRTVLPFIRTRLLAALALRRNDPQALRPALLECPARIFAGPTHVDVRMSLTDIRVPVRIAGLDANPGWVPALGRVITFYFD